MTRRVDSPVGVGGDASPLNELIEILKRKGYAPRSSGDHWLARCPSHEDRVASLSLTASSDQRVLLHCHAGCAPEAVLRALGLTLHCLFPAQDSGVMQVKKYDIRDSAGQLVARHIRRDSPGKGKKFSWEGPNGQTGLGGRRVTALPLYGSELVRTWPPEAPIILVEGEKAADALIQSGFCALGAVTGAASCPGPEALSVLRGHSVTLWPDWDAAGRKHMRRMAAALQGGAADLRVFEWPGGPEGADAHDFLAFGPEARERLCRELERAVPVEEWLLKSLPPADGADTAAAGGPNMAVCNPDGRVRSPATQATRLLELADDIELFHTPRKEAFATVAVGDHRETLPLRSSGFRFWLRHRWFEKYRTAPSTQAIQDALDVLEARATFEAPEIPIFTRVASHERKIYLDLANPRWEAIEVTPRGWQVTPTPAVKFRRPRGMAALPRPVQAGTIHQLRPFANLASEDDWALLVTWIVAALRPQGPYPVLALHGEQGSAKSTTARVVRSLIDPSEVALRCEPQDKRDLMIAATNSWVQACDNLSHMPPWFSDALCRLATGGGLATRELYSDGEEVLFEAQRPVILNGIEELAARNDLLDRAIILTLPPIDEGRRRPEGEFWRDFEAVRPSVLGALLDAVSVALRVEPGIRLRATPRMADFAVWGAAASPGLGWGPAAFARAYGDNREGAQAAAVDDSPVWGPLRGLAAREGHWEGTATELLEQLSPSRPGGDGHRPGWPANARGLSNWLRRHAPNLRAQGFEVTFPRRHGGRRTVVLRTPDHSSVPSVSQTPSHGELSLERDAAPVGLAAPDDTLRHPSGSCVTPPRRVEEAICGDGDAGDGGRPGASGTPRDLERATVKGVMPGTSRSPLAEFMAEVREATGGDAT